jgi:hypothetical protein
MLLLPSHVSSSRQPAKSVQPSEPLANAVPTRANAAHRPPLLILAEAELPRSEVSSVSGLITSAFKERPPAEYHAKFLRRPCRTRMRKIKAFSVRRHVIDGAPVTLGESRDVHGRGCAEGKAAIRSRADRYPLQETLRVDVEQFVAVAAPTRADRRRSSTRRTVAAAPTRCAPKRPARPIRLTRTRAIDRLVRCARHVP